MTRTYEEKLQAAKKAAAEAIEADDQHRRKIAETESIVWNDCQFLYSGASTRVLQNVFGSDVLAKVYVIEGEEIADDGDCSQVVLEFQKGLRVVFWTSEWGGICRWEPEAP